MKNESKLELYKDGLYGISHFKSLRDASLVAGEYPLDNGYTKANGDISPKFYVHMELAKYRETIDTGIEIVIKNMKNDMVLGKRILKKYLWLAEQYIEVIKILRSVTEFKEENYGKIDLSYYILAKELVEN
jgi:hypothetical protein